MAYTKKNKRRHKIKCENIYIKKYNTDVKIKKANLHILSLIISKKNNRLIKLYNDTVKEYNLKISPLLDKMYEHSLPTIYEKVNSIRDNRDKYDFMKELFENYKSALSTLENFRGEWDFNIDLIKENENLLNKNWDKLPDSITKVYHTIVNAVGGLKNWELLESYILDFELDEENTIYELINKHWNTIQENMIEKNEYLDNRKKILENNKNVKTKLEREIKMSRKFEKLVNDLWKFEPEELEDVLYEIENIEDATNELEKELPESTKNFMIKSLKRSQDIVNKFSLQSGIQKTRVKEGILKFLETMKR